MYIERAADRDDNTTHWLVCDAAGKVLKFCRSENEAATWLAARGLRNDDR
jgi:hypothetical protein